ncbi:dihydrofolate synthase / folylpolyglutamate synthase [Desulfacinum hydrothermale DSM 13146]|uniref:Dihydrofolate synthase/folylpolyglutamate synthase n=1 Tax=Desulfacinum hydrothermale DSM 13146 TaxID=1121390 RepID=A0A1W1XV20_9BACT|nr:folylpolyglutamate synthase/dihydrofolate synthase family protein [Desulfacinum hydrothermale]SMC27793.1 dihydrofolate synthase / folylpolyglutamate synthase [Desulfacinum hydrothermale DSM 13146]
MIHEYEKAVQFLFNLQKAGIKFGLNRTESLLSRLGNPHHRFSALHIAGTNGKGSTAAMIAAILHRHGFRVGLYTSPHLVRFTERFRIDDKEVSPHKVFRAFEHVMEVVEGDELPTFFEAVTAMAFQLFAAEGVEWAVVETGMGGRLDATNLLEPRVSIITNVALDHQEFLGSTLSAVAREKAGIIKKETPVLTAARQPVVLSAFKTRCLKMRAPLLRLGTHFRVRRNGSRHFTYDGLHRRWPHLPLGLLGEHQCHNAALALAALELLEEQDVLRLDLDRVREGLAHVHWPGRLEILEHNPVVMVDGAHNPSGAESLRNSLTHFFRYRKLHLVMGIMADKDIRGIFRRLLPHAETAIFTRPRYGRAADPELLRRLAKPYIQRHYVVDHPADAIAQAKDMATEEDLICITGSLYFIGEVKELYGEPFHPHDQLLA